MRVDLQAFTGRSRLQESGLPRSGYDECFAAGTTERKVVRMENSKDANAHALRPHTFAHQTDKKQ
jgi:hypothetical protein